MRTSPSMTAFYFYPRSPCGERPAPAPKKKAAARFLSTLSLRRATPKSLTRPCSGRYFYPRSPCGERPGQDADRGRCPYFYPRSPCGERPGVISAIAYPPKFLSTLSLRRATSLHSARSGTWHHFYPRSPCGERLQDNLGITGTTAISIHALLAESDPQHAG